MKILIHTTEDHHRQGVEEFLNKFKFGNVAFRQRQKGSPLEPSEDGDGPIFCLEVLDGDDDYKAIDLETKLEGGPCSLLFYNQDVKIAEEPKVIFATDHSDQASLNLERFKKLKPAGFAGATVITESDPNSSGIVNHEMNLKFLAQMRSAVQSNQANVIIANFDLRNLSRKSSQLSNILKLVLQNRCHVLVLKA